MHLSILLKDIRVHVMFALAGSNFLEIQICLINLIAYSCIPATATTPAYHFATLIPGDSIYIWGFARKNFQEKKDKVSINKNKASTFKSSVHDLFFSLTKTFDDVFQPLEMFSSHMISPCTWGTSQKCRGNQCVRPTSCAGPTSSAAWLFCLKHQTIPFHTCPLRNAIIIYVTATKTYISTSSEQKVRLTLLKNHFCSNRYTRQEISPKSIPTIRAKWNL